MKRTYTVKKGDCLWNIAKKYYGRGALYKKIWYANSDQIINPNIIEVGQVLRIPYSWRELVILLFKRRK